MTATSIAWMPPPARLIWKRRAGPSDEKVLGNGRMISLWPVRTSVLVDNGVVHFAAGVFPYEGLYVYALNAEDGSVVWVNDTIGDRAHELEFGGMSPHGYLVASSQILYVPSGRAMPAAFDRASGKFLFFASPGGKRGGTWALLDDNRLIAGVDSSGTPNKAAYDAASGARQEDAFAWFAGTDMAVTSGCRLPGQRRRRVRSQSRGLHRRRWRKPRNWTRSGRRWRTNSTS